MATDDEGSGSGSIPDSSGKSSEDSSINARRERTARLRGTLAKQVSAPDPYVPDPYMTASSPAHDSSSPSSGTQSNSVLPPATSDQPVSASPAYETNPSMTSPTPAPLPATAVHPGGSNAQAPSWTLELPAVSEDYQQEVVAPQKNNNGSNNVALSAAPNAVPAIADFSSSTQPAQVQLFEAPAPAPALDPAESAGYTFGINTGAAPQAVAPPAGDSPTTSNNMASTTGNDEPVPKIPSVAGVPMSDPQIQAQAVEVLNNIDQSMGACAMNLSALQKIASEQTDTLRNLAESMQNQNMFEMGLNLNNLMETLSAAVEPMKAVGELVPAIDQLVSTLEAKESRPAEEKHVRPSPEQLVTSLADQLSAGIIDPWTFKCAYMAVFPAEHPADLLHRLVDLLGTQRLSGDLFRAAYDAVQAAEPLRRSGEGDSERTIVQVVQDENLVRELEELRKRQAEMARQNEELAKSNEELIRSNEELAKRPKEQVFTQDDGKLAEMSKIIEELQKRLDHREGEFSGLMAGKDQELQEAQELLNSRWEEFNARYDELTETLHKRDELIAEREAEITRKDSENLQLKTQMEELRDQTKDMVSEMQKQLTQAAAKPKDEPRSPGFFDPAPSGAAAAPQPGTLFDSNPARQPLFQPAAQAPAAAQPAPQPVQPAPQPGMAPQPQMAQPQPQQQPLPQSPQPAPNTSQAIPRPAPTTAPFLTGGSYGSGVRAQVFEVIVRQALAGAPWKEICAGPMSVNNITPEEVEAEVKRRQALLGKK